MLKNFTLLLLSLFFFTLCRANMASPLQSGTKTSAAFGSNAISITKESILIKIDSGFNNAKFTVTYFINTALAGNQIPLLFVALDYRKDFKVWIDDRLVSVNNLPENFLNENPFGNNFKNSLVPSNEEEKSVKIYWDANNYTNYLYTDLKYFEVNLSKGDHKIKVEYTAYAWRDKTDYSIQKSFRYALSPVKFWKNFNALEVSIEQEDAGKDYKINFDNKPAIVSSHKKVWTFSSLPADFINITYQMKIPKTAAFLIDADPFYLMIMLAFLLFGVNMLLVYNYRKKHVKNKMNPFVWAGSLLNCVIILVSYSLFYFLIDYLIGPEASGHGGYSFFIILFYPFLLLFYWGTLFFWDWYLKRKWRPA